MKHFMGGGEYKNKNFMILKNSGFTLGQANVYLTLWTVSTYTFKETK